MLSYLFNFFEIIRIPKVFKLTLKIVFSFSIFYAVLMPAIVSGSGFSTQGLVSFGIYMFLYCFLCPCLAGLSAIWSPRLSIFLGFLIFIFNLPVPFLFSGGGSSQLSADWIILPIAAASVFVFFLFIGLLVFPVISYLNWKKRDKHR